MESIVSNLRNVLGVPEFYSEGAWDYSAMLEYLVGAIILCIVVSSVFRFLGKLVSR